MRRRKELNYFCRFEAENRNLWHRRDFATMRKIKVRGAPQMYFHFHVNSNIAFGCSAAECLPELIEKYNLKKIMVIYDSGVRAAGISDVVMGILRRTNVQITVFDEVIPNPTNELVEEAAERARSAGVDGFVAVGGGSSIDTAKAANILMTNPGKIGSYAGIGTVKNRCLPLIAIPTTSGTSSEITNVSALNDTQKICKYVIIDDKITPSEVIADPNFTRTVPPAVSAATGMDAITHAVESCISNVSSPLTKYHSLTGLKLLYDNIEAVYEDGDNMEARTNMMLGCIITGFAFSNANLGIVHAIAHVLSAHHHLAHGDANACVLPYCLAYNAPCCPDRMVEMAKAIGCRVSGDRKKDKYLLSDAMCELNRKLNIRSLRQHGVKEEEVVALADDVLKEPVLHFNPRQDVTKEDIVSILRKAY